MLFHVFYDILLPDLRDLFCLVVTGCENNPEWLRQNEYQLNRSAFGVIPRNRRIAVGFPCGGSLEPVYKELRADQLKLLREWLEQHAISQALVPASAFAEGSAFYKLLKKLLQYCGIFIRDRWYQLLRAMGLADEEIKQIDN